MNGGPPFLIAFCIRLPCGIPIFSLGENAPPSLVEVRPLGGAQICASRVYHACLLGCRPAPLRTPCSPVPCDFCPLVLFLHSAWSVCSPGCRRRPRGTCFCSCPRALVFLSVCVSSDPSCSVQGGDPWTQRKPAESVSLAGGSCGLWALLWGHWRADVY